MKRLLLAAMAVASVGWTPAVVYAKDSLNAAVWIPPKHQYSRYLYSYFADRVADRSKGEFKVTVDLGSAVVSPRGAMAELSDGIVDITAHAGPYTPTDLPYGLAVEELSMQFDDPRLVSASVADFNVNDPEMLAEWKKNGVVYGAPYTTNSYKLICNKEVANLEQLAGAKVRMPGRAPSAWVKSAGGTTVAFNSNEQYGALDKGALTCTTTTVADAYARKMHEVAKHVTDLPISVFWSGFGIAYNPTAWAELTPDQRHMLFNSQADALAALIVRGTFLEEEEAREKMAAAGVKFHKPSADLQASINAFRETQLASATQVAKETFNVANPEEMFARFEATVEKWRGLLADVPIEDEAAFANLLRSQIYDKIDYSTYGVY